MLVYMVDRSTPSLIPRSRSFSASGPFAHDGFQTPLVSKDFPAFEVQDCAVYASRSPPPATWVPSCTTFPARSTTGSVCALVIPWYPSPPFTMAMALSYFVKSTVMVLPEAFIGAPVTVGPKPTVTPLPSPAKPTAPRAFDSAFALSEFGFIVSKSSLAFLTALLNRVCSAAQLLSPEAHALKSYMPVGSIRESGLLLT